MQKYKYAYIDSATTTQVFTGACTLHRIILTETAAGTITIADSASASTPVVALLKASMVEGEFDFGVGLATGLRIVTGAASKLTVVYSVN
jgi:hypothetical protein